MRIGIRIESKERCSWAKTNNQTVNKMSTGTRKGTAMQTRYSQALGCGLQGLAVVEVQPWEERDSEPAAEYRKWKPGPALPHSINKECIKAARSHSTA